MYKLFLLYHLVMSFWNPQCMLRKLRNIDNCAVSRSVKTHSPTMLMANKKFLMRVAHTLWLEGWPHWHEHLDLCIHISPQ